MSEDEAIKRLQEILDFKKNTIDKIDDPIEREIEENCYIEEMPFKAIETILDLYKKEKEKNKELSIIKEGIRVLQNNGLMDEQYIVIANWNLKNTSYKHLLDDYISKEKIRAKIKELENLIETNSLYEECWNKIEVLKELLERR